MNPPRREPPPGGTNRKRANDRSRSRSRNRIRQIIGIEDMNEKPTDFAEQQKNDNLSHESDQETAKSTKVPNIQESGKVNDSTLYSELFKPNVTISSKETHPQIHNNEVNQPRKPEINPDFLMYDANDKGPYWVLIQRNSEGEQNSASLTDIGIGKLLNKVGCKSITSIKRNNANSVKIFFKDFKSANALLKTNLEPYKVNAFIPKSYIMKQGIINGIPFDITEDELVANIKSPIKVIEASRFTRKGDGELRLPTSVVKITFKGNRIPQEISIYGAIRSVGYYTPKPRFCNKCLRWGHYLPQCKATVTLCTNCSQENCTNDNCKNNAFCINCKTSHRPDNPDCLAKEKERDLLKLIAIKNINRREANSLLKQNDILPNSDNPFSILGEQDLESAFPHLTHPQKIRNPDQDANRVILRKKSYSKIVKVFPDNANNNYYNKLLGPQDMTKGVALTTNEHKVNEYEKILKWITGQLINVTHKGNSDDNPFIRNLRNKIKLLETNIDLHQIQSGKTNTQTNNSNLNATENDRLNNTI